MNLYFFILLFLYFYYLTIISFVLLALSAADKVYHMAKGKVNPVSALLALVGPALLYFNNRLLYSMCLH